MNSTRDGRVTESQAVEGLRKLLLIGKRFPCDSILRDGFRQAVLHSQRLPPDSAWLGFPEFRLLLQ